MAEQKVNKILDIETKKLEYRKEVEIYLQSNIESKIDFWLIVGAFRTSKWWIKFTILMFLVWNLGSNGYTSFFGKNTMCTWLNITIFIFQLESLILYVCAYLCVTDSFLKEVVNALTKIIIESKEYKDVMSNIGKNNNVSRHSISMLNDTLNNHQYKGCLHKLKSCIESCCFCFIGRDTINVNDDDRKAALIDDSINTNDSLSSLQLSNTLPFNKAQKAYNSAK